MDIHALLGDEAESLLTHKCAGISQDLIHLPGPDFLDRSFIGSDRSPQVLRNRHEPTHHIAAAEAG